MERECFIWHHSYCRNWHSRWWKNVGRNIYIFVNKEETNEDFDNHDDKENRKLKNGDNNNRNIVDAEYVNNLNKENNKIINNDLDSLKNIESGDNNDFHENNLVPVATANIEIESKKGSKDIEEVEQDNGIDLIV